eukprot:TRINITY_DN22421_c0_g1_i1.p1 TRINITY_DN22421_c0_g1~~TRINITY_DN22421_c0_g1_i1.p1  ORF type:complete len:810 (+),score=64.55 TRINITY_DN22421_c0_g1_i1:134-2563(+)
MPISSPLSSLRSWGPSDALSSSSRSESQRLLASGASLQRAGNSPAVSAHSEQRRGEGASQVQHSLTRGNSSLKHLGLGSEASTHTPPSDPDQPSPSTTGADGLSPGHQSVTSNESPAASSTGGSSLASLAAAARRTHQLPPTAQPMTPSGSQGVPLGRFGGVRSETPKQTNQNPYGSLGGRVTSTTTSPSSSSMSPAGNNSAAEYTFSSARSPATVRPATARTSQEVQPNSTALKARGYTPQRSSPILSARGTPTNSSNSARAGVRTPNPALARSGSLQEGLGTPRASLGAAVGSRAPPAAPPAPASSGAASTPRDTGETMLPKGLRRCASLKEEDIADRGAPRTPSAVAGGGYSSFPPTMTRSNSAGPKSFQQVARPVEQLPRPAEMAAVGRPPRRPLFNRPDQAPPTPLSARREAAPSEPVWIRDDSPHPRPPPPATPTNTQDVQSSTDFASLATACGLASCPCETCGGPAALQPPRKSQSHRKSHRSGATSSRASLSAAVSARSSMPTSSSGNWKLEDVDDKAGGLSGSANAGLEAYALGKMLGRGAFGKVNVGVHRQSNQQVAIKFCDKKRGSEVGAGGAAGRRNNLNQEVKVLRLLTGHPSITELHEVIESSTQIILVMELCPLGDMQKLVKRRRALVEDCGRRLFNQLLGAIEHMHSQRVAHRDLKLENLLLCDKGNLKVADFGVAMIVEPPGRKLWDTCGTLSYMAPEVLLKAGYDPWPADLWSAGVALHAMLCGAVPFKGDDMDQIRKRILKGRSPAPSYLSVSAVSLLHGLLETDPVKRTTVQDALLHLWSRGSSPHDDH